MTPVKVYYYPHKHMLRRLIGRTNSDEMKNKIDFIHDRNFMRTMLSSISADGEGTHAWNVRMNMVRQVGGSADAFVRLLYEQIFDRFCEFFTWDEFDDDDYGEDFDEASFE